MTLNYKGLNYIVEVGQGKRGKQNLNGTKAIKVTLQKSFALTFAPGEATDAESAEYERQYRQFILGYLTDMADRKSMRFLSNININTGEIPFEFVDMGAEEYWEEWGEIERAVFGIDVISYTKNKFVFKPFATITVIDEIFDYVGDVEKFLVEADIMDKIEKKFSNFIVKATEYNRRAYSNIKRATGRTNVRPIAMSAEALRKTGGVAPVMKESQTQVTLRKFYEGLLSKIMTEAPQEVDGKGNFKDIDVNALAENIMKRIGRTVKFGGYEASVNLRLVIGKGTDTLLETDVSDEDDLASELEKFVKKNTKEN